MEPTNKIMFKKAFLTTFALLAIPGKYKVQVLNNVSEKNLFTDNKGRQRYIIGLRAIASDQLPQLREVFKDGQDEVEIEQTNGLFLTATIWKKNEEDQPALPMKGEEVEVTFGQVENREGDPVLRVTNIHVLPAKKAETFSLDNLIVSEVEMAEAGSGAIAQ